MFFSITHHADDRFPFHHDLGPFVIGTDAGWSVRTTQHHTLLYKGYLDHHCIDQRLDQIRQEQRPGHTGNFCVMVYDHHSQQIDIKTDRWRSFPMYYDQNRELTNLVPLSKTVWCDGVVTIDADLWCKELTVEFDFSTKSSASTLDDIDVLLADKIQAFVKHNRLPIKIMLSGGVDTTLLYSYMLRFGIDHEVIWESHRDHDYFFLANHHDLIQYWGYIAMPHYRNPCVIVSGAPGDEFTLRSPSTCNQWLLANGSSIPAQLDLHPDCLHAAYFAKYQSLYADQQRNFQPPDDIVQHICDINLNDWQHWHLGHTLTWTPLRDLELLKLFLALPSDLIKGQIMNSDVSMALIERNHPGLSDIVSDQKNVGNYMRNLRKLLI